MKTQLVLILLAYSCCASAQLAPSIAEFSASLAPSQTLPLSQRIRLTISSSHAETLYKTLSQYHQIEAEIIDSNTLEVSMGKRPQYASKIANNHRKYLQDSFVIDFSEASSQDFIAAFRAAALSYSPSNASSLKLGELEAFVSKYIDKPSYVNVFNIASVVATQRSGDCTEYAVLLAALVRAHDVPARVMLGTVLIDDGTSLRAVGHAWVEAYKDQQWHILDSALYRLIGASRYYLPAQALNNEGLGFAMSVAQSVNLIPQKIENVRSLKE